MLRACSLARPPYRNGGTKGLPAIERRWTSCPQFAKIACGQAETNLSGTLLPEPVPRSGSLTNLGALTKYIYIYGVYIIEMYVYIHPRSSGAGRMYKIYSVYKYIYETWKLPNFGWGKKTFTAQFPLSKCFIPAMRRL